MKIQNQKSLNDLAETLLLLLVIVLTAAFLTWICKDFPRHPLSF